VPHLRGKNLKEAYQTVGPTSALENWARLMFVRSGISKAIAIAIESIVIEKKT
jgi:hypothetical protein